MLTLLNSPRLTAFGTYRYRRVTLRRARALVARGFVSAVGHKSAAERIGELLDIEVPYARVDYRQLPGEQALVFQLKERLPEGAVLDRATLERLGYEFGVLTRLT